MRSHHKRRRQHTNSRRLPHLCWRSVLPAGAVARHVARSVPACCACGGGTRRQGAVEARLLRAATRAQHTQPRQAVITGTMCCLQAPACALTHTRAHARTHAPLHASRPLASVRHHAPWQHVLAAAAAAAACGWRRLHYCCCCPAPAAGCCHRRRHVRSSSSGATLQPSHRAPQAWVRAAGELLRASMLITLLHCS